MGIADIFGVGPVATVIDDILKMFPNADQRQAVELKLQDLAIAVANNQSATNTAEATTGSIFLSGWRPMLGWICAFGFTYSIAQPVFHGQPLDVATLNNLLWGMLGLGTWRSADKLGGVVTSAIKKIIK